MNNTKNKINQIKLESYLVESENQFLEHVSLLKRKFLKRKAHFETQKDCFRIRRLVLNNFREIRISVSRKFNPNLDLTRQEDAQSYSLPSLWEKYKNGVSLPIGALKDDAQYGEQPYPDITNLKQKDNENSEKFKTKNFAKKSDDILDKANSDYNELVEKDKVNKANAKANAVAKSASLFKSTE